MATLLQPTGLRPYGASANGPYQAGFTTYELTTNNTLAIAVGDHVGLVGGSIVAGAATPVSATLSSNTPIGVVAGVEYQDPNTPGRGLVESQLLPANAVTAGYKKIRIRVYDDSRMRFTIQADGSVTQAQLGASIAIGNYGSSPDTTAKTSRLFAQTSTLDQGNSSNTKALKIVGFDRNDDNAPGDAFTRLIVTWNVGVHYHTFAGAH